MSERTWTPEEQAAHREGWVAALLSDLYPQGAGYLKNVDGEFCCLGVACELAAEAGIVEWVDTEDERGYQAVVEGGYVVYNDTLPPVVRNWLGLSDVSGETVEGHDNGESDVTVHTLVELNDDFAWDFRRIAELITAGGVRLAEGGS